MQTHHEKRHCSTRVLLNAKVARTKAEAQLKAVMLEEATERWREGHKLRWTKPIPCRRSILLHRRRHFSDHLKARKVNKGVAQMLYKSIPPLGPSRAHHCFARDAIESLWAWNYSSDHHTQSNE